ncbi:MerR family transcriptional regulator [Parabacteroides sp. 52]|uniref:MerR family transcriptional regulator n=1 Tax=unclassified Parabacteroides TaxID=2649774 RepID=UPI0013D188BA|nr:MULTISPECIES: MerR family transcriptional regulator [unclassified Parabacteroides]MDH6534081.1 DNA-binding transcriptional MerR regulator [Parabacteroides sp. PM5-20]NDV55015.1 MerR family transcriptional regulator [Parabacteroides sp. 52]
MALKKEKPAKLYYSISEVAQMFDINESTLRFWEKEFDVIRPRKTAKGTRFYKQEDIDSVRLIYYLVKERGMTLAGARQRLKENKDSTVRQEDIIHRLKQIKEELLSMKEAFDNIDPKE